MLKNRWLLKVTGRYHPDHGICSVVFPLETHQYCFSIVFYSTSNEGCYIWSIAALIRFKACSRWCSAYVLRDNWNFHPRMPRVFRFHANIYSKNTRRSPFDFLPFFFRKQNWMHVSNRPSSYRLLNTLPKVAMSDSWKNRSLDSDLSNKSAECFRIGRN